MNLYYIALKKEDVILVEFTTVDPNLPKVKTSNVVSDTYTRDCVDSSNSMFNLSLGKR